MGVSASLPEGGFCCSFYAFIQQNPAQQRRFYSFSRCVGRVNDCHAFIDGSEKQLVLLISSWVLQTVFFCLAGDK